MNRENLADFTKQLFLHLRRGHWHALDDASDFSPTLSESLQLQPYQLETIFLATGIAYLRSDKLCFSLRNLEQLQATYADLELHYNRYLLQKGGRHTVFICIGKPQHQSPQIQAVNCHIRPRRNNELDRSM